MKYLIFVIALLVCSCKSTKYIEVPVEVEKVKIEYVTQYEKDSLATKDSIYVTDSVIMYVKGDTITEILKKYIYRDKIVYRDKFTTDTICKIDSIPYIKTVYLPVDVAYWLKILMWIGGIISFLVLSLLCWKLFNFIKLII